MSYIFILQLQPTTTWHTLNRYFPPQTKSNKVKARRNLHHLEIGQDWPQEKQYSSTQGRISHNVNFSGDIVHGLECVDPIYYLRYKGESSGRLGISDQASMSIGKVIYSRESQWNVPMKIREFFYWKFAWCKRSALNRKWWGMRDTLSNLCLRHRCEAIFAMARISMRTR